MKMTTRRSTVFLLFAALSIIAACNKGTPHLPPAVMQKVLLDISVAETYTTMERDSLHKAGIKNYDSLAVYYKSIFKHYNITQQQFDESMAWYKEHPVELDSVYAGMIGTLTRYQATYDRRGPK